MKIYILENQLLQKNRAEWLSYLEPNDIKRICNYSNTSAQTCALASRLFCKSISPSGILLFSEKGKPFFKGNSDFNISHTAEYTVLCKDVSPVGADIESLSRFCSQKLLRRLFSAEECDYLASGKFSRFPLLWTRKEAVLKCCGCGLVDSLYSVPVLNNCVQWRNEQYYLHSFIFRDHVISVSKKIPIQDISISILDSAGLKKMIGIGNN